MKELIEMYKEDPQTVIIEAINIMVAYGICTAAWILLVIIFGL